MSIPITSVVITAPVKILASLRVKGKYSFEAVVPTPSILLDAPVRYSVECSCLLPELLEAREKALSPVALINTSKAKKDASNAQQVLPVGPQSVAAHALLDSMGVSDKALREEVTGMYERHISTGGFVTIRDWRYMHWGCPSDLFDAKLSGSELSFKTEHMSPFKVIMALRKANPDIKWSWTSVRDYGQGNTVEDARIYS